MGGLPFKAAIATSIYGGSPQYFVFRLIGCVHERNLNSTWKRLSEKSARFSLTCWPLLDLSNTLESIYYSEMKGKRNVSGYTLLDEWLS